MEIVVGCSVLLFLYQKIKCKIRCALTDPCKFIGKFILHSIYLQVCIRQVHRTSSMTYTSFSGSFGPNRCVVYVSDWYAEGHSPNPPLNKSRNTYLAVSMTLNTMIRPFRHQRSNPCQSLTSHVVQFRLCAGKRIFYGSISKDVGISEQKSIKPRCKKSCLRDFRPGSTQNSLLSFKNSSFISDIDARCDNSLSYITYAIHITFGMYLIRNVNTTCSL